MCRDKKRHKNEKKKRRPLKQKQVMLPKQRAFSHVSSAQMLAETINVYSGRSRDEMNRSREKSSKNGVDQRWIAYSRILN